MNHDGFGSLASEKLRLPEAETRLPGDTADPHANRNSVRFESDCDPPAVPRAAGVIVRWLTVQDDCRGGEKKPVGASVSASGWVSGAACSAPGICLIRVSGTWATTCRAAARS